MGGGDNGGEGGYIFSYIRFAVLRWLVQYIYPKLVYIIIVLCSPVQQMRCADKKAHGRLPFYIQYSNSEQKNEGEGMKSGTTEPNVRR